MKRKINNDEDAKFMGECVSNLWKEFDAEIDRLFVCTIATVLAVALKNGMTMEDCYEKLQLSWRFSMEAYKKCLENDRSEENGI